MILKGNSMRIGRLALAAVSMMVISTAGAFAQEEGDAEKGEKVFKKCKSCHQVGEDAKNRAGPLLNNIFGRAAGTGEDFKYGKSIVAAGEAGLLWNAETLDGWLTYPKQFLKDTLDSSKAKTKMSLKLKKEADRLNVIAYLAQFSEIPEEMEEEVEAESEEATDG